MKKNRLLLASLILNILFVFAGIIIIAHEKDKINEKLSTRFPKVFRGNRKIVLYGNSLTFMGNWNNYLDRNDLKNSGLIGYTTSHLALLINESVIRYKPEVCFIEGGINDIRTGIPLARTYNNFSAIVDTLLSKDIIPVLQSTLFVRLPDDEVTNMKIDSLNKFLKVISVSHNITFIDLNILLSEGNRIKKEYTTDGIHLNKEAYKIWARKIKSVLVANKI